MLWFAGTWRLLHLLMLPENIQVILCWSYGVYEQHILLYMHSDPERTTAAPSLSGRFGLNGRRRDRKWEMIWVTSGG